MNSGDCTVSIGVPQVLNMGDGVSGTNAYGTEMKKGENDSHLPQAPHHYLAGHPARRHPETERVKGKNNDREIKKGLRFQKLTNE